MGREMVLVVQTHHRMLMESLLAAAGAGFLAAMLALRIGWLALDSRGFRSIVLVLAALAWALPGPVLGIGLKDTINVLMSVEESITGAVGRSGPGPVRVGLYDGPSPLPPLWASLVRFFPCAVAVLWPVLRLVPKELRDAARVDGASPGAELRYLVGPLTAAAWLRTVWQWRCCRWAS